MNKDPEQAAPERKPKKEPKQRKNVIRIDTEIDEPQVEQLPPDAMDALKGIAETLADARYTATETFTELIEFVNYLIDSGLLKRIEEISKWFNDNGEFFQIEHETPSIMFEFLEKADSRKEDAIQILEALKKEADSSNDKSLFDLILNYIASNKQGIKAPKVGNPLYPIDRINRTVWYLMEQNIKSLPEGQIGILLEKKNGEAIVATYFIDFSKLDEKSGIIKDLTQFDKRVFIAAGSLYQTTDTFSFNSLHKAMGYTSRPSQNALEKIKNSLIKMNTAQIGLDNQMEIDAGINYKHFEYHGSLLPSEFIIETIGGKITNSAVHLFREPPLITFAKERKQITQLKLALIQSPISKTEYSLAIEDYLIETISLKKGERTAHKKQLYKLQKTPNNKLTDKDKERIPKLQKEISAPFTVKKNTILDGCHITNRLARTRADETIKILLDHYKKLNFISGYEPTADGYRITLPD